MQTPTEEKQGDNDTKFLDIVQYEEIWVPKVFVDMYPNWSVEEKLEQIKEMAYSEGDILLCSFPKTGTHWVTSLLSLLFYNGSIELSPSFNVKCIEAFPLEIISALPSPKVVHTHLMSARLPQEISTKSKVILLLRNPKDVAVSMYCYLQETKVFRAEQSWVHFLGTFFTGPVIFGPYTEYLKSFEKVLKQDKGSNIHVVYYEDLKQDGLTEMKKLNKFLGCSHSDEQLQAILDRCSLKKLKHDIIEGKTEAIITNVHGDVAIYRKGEIGDWKNYFTVAQSEDFDAQWRAQMKDSMFHFRYT